MEGPIQIIELKVNGKNLYAEWFENLDQREQNEVDARMERVRQGNLGPHRNLRSGMVEIKFSSGLRIYGGWEGKTLFLLILGGEKKGQSKDIEIGEEIWLNYTKQRGTRK